MHELSVVAALIELCEENARANGAAKISEIHAKMGVLSGIDRAQFERCFEAFRQGTMCENAALFIESENLRGRCECGFEGEILGLNFDLNSGLNHDLNSSLNCDLNSSSNSGGDLNLNANLDSNSQNLNENLALNSSSNLSQNLKLNAQNFNSNLDLNFNSHLNSNSNSALNSNLNLNSNSSLNFDSNLNSNFSSNLALNSNLDFHCPKCGSNELKITAGEDFYLMRLVME